MNLPMLPCEHVGEILRPLRESRDMSPAAFADALTAAGYAITLALYSEIENHTTLPQDGGAFLDACAAALRLSPGEERVLTTQYAFDILTRELGQHRAREYLRDSLASCMAMV